MALKLSSPWMIWYRKVNALFANDPEVTVIFDEDESVVNVYVESSDKADALAQLLPAEKTFGNVTVTVKVIPANGNVLKSNRSNLFERAFSGNPALSFVRVMTGIMLNDLTYVVFHKEVVQFFTDNLGDYYGNCSTLYEALARDVFEEIEGVCYCTDKDERVGCITCTL